MTLSGMATVYHDIGESSEALRIYQQALLIHREVGDRVGEIATLINMATVHHDMGELSKALHLYQQVLPVCRESGDRPGEAQALNNMATLYRALDQPGEALDLYQQALPIHREISNPQGEAGTLVNMGAVYYIFNQLDDALHLYQQALSIYRKIGDRHGEATALSNMATLYHDLGQPQEELRCNQQALSIRREIDDRAGQVASLINMAYLLRDRKRYQEALRTFTEATELAHQIAQPANECAALVGSAMVLYQDLNRKQEGVAAMMQAIAILDRWELPQDASRHTLLDLRRALKQMKTGNPLGQASHEKHETKAIHLVRDKDKRVREKAVMEQGDLNLIRTTIGNTIAVFTNSPEHRDVWRSDLVDARNQLRQVSDKNLAAFLDSVIDLLDADGDPEGLGSHLTGPYQEAWQALIATLAMRRDTPKRS